MKQEKNIKTKARKLKDAKNSNKGITLIALVITIVVLLILAAVSIATLTGQNGILTQASNAKTNTEIADEKEAIGLAYNGIMIANQGNGVDANDLQLELINNGYDVVAKNEDDGTIKVTFNDSQKVYKINKNGNIEEIQINTFTLEYADEIIAYEFYDGETWIEWMERNSEINDLGISLLKSTMDQISEGDEISANVASGLYSRLYYIENETEIIPKNTDVILNSMAYIIEVKPR